MTYLDLGCKVIFKISSVLLYTLGETNSDLETALFCVNHGRLRRITPGHLLRLLNDYSGNTYFGEL